MTRSGHDPAIASAGDERGQTPVSWRAWHRPHDPSRAARADTRLWIVVAVLYGGVVAGWVLLSSV